MRLQHAVLCAAAAVLVLAMSACDPKDVYGPEEGPPPRDGFFFSVSVETEASLVDREAAELPDDMSLTVPVPASEHEAPQEGIE
jgi:hypothetical protein